MYKCERYRQIGLADFNQPLGLKMNPKNCWVKKAETILWDAIEERYAKLFPSKTGMSAKPLRTALGSLLIQKQLFFLTGSWLKRSLKIRIYNTFIGLPGFQKVPPFVHLCSLNPVSTELPKYLDQTDRSFLEDLLPWTPKLLDRIRKPVKPEPQVT